MVKTTVYLPEDLKFALGRVAASRGESEAEVIRVALQLLVDAEPRPRPRGGLIHGGPSDIARHVDEYLKGDAEHPGFGEW
ncbi:MAG: antitoxin [Acidobacteriota bacterium]|nr:antitoxin [Acidobacteriota bacterium]